MTTELILAPNETCEGKTRFPITDCPHMRPVEQDFSAEYEHYECKVCGKRDKLDYEEMK